MKLFKGALEDEFDVERFDVVTISNKEEVKRFETSELKKLI